jgi:hypothetical protein
MTGDHELTEAELAQRREAPLKHGLRSEFAQTGDERTLTEPQRGRLAELRADLATPDGVRQALIERAARSVLIAEWGESWLRDVAEREGAVKAFTSPMLARLFTAIAEARRGLESLSKMQAKGDGGLSAADVLQAVKREQG